MSGDDVAQDAMTKQAARRLTERIKLTYGTAQEAVDKLVELIGQARDGKAHEALGYKSWTAYCAAEFDVQLKLPAADRKELVLQLSELGMSTRAIAPVAGVSKNSVQRDLATVPLGTVDSPVTGVNGKTYQRPGPKARRAPLPDAFKRQSSRLLATTRSIRRLTEDDRFDKSRGQLAELIENELTQVIEQAQQTLAALRGESK